MAGSPSRPGRANALFLALAVLLPPLAIPLLLRRPDRITTKVLGSVLLVLLTALYLDLGSGLLRRTAAPSAAHWRALEAHREAQAGEARRSGERAARAELVEGAVSAAAGARLAAVGPAPAGVDDGSAAPAGATAGRYWTGFRGPGSAGRYDEMPVVAEWPGGELPLLWKQPIGEGWGSFAVADGVAYTLERRRGDEVAAAYDLLSGRELWTASWDSSFSEAADRDGPRATPVWDDGRVYALGAAGDLVALDATTGEVLWRREILDENDAANIRWGVSASPLVAGDLLVTVPGGRAGRAVVAYDKVTGNPRWSALDDAASYTTPMLVTLAGREQLLVVTATRAVGLEPADGTLLWEHPWATDMGVNAAQPVVVGPDRFVLSAGYGHGAELVEIVAADGAFSARAIWQTNRLKNKLSSSVHHDGHIYGLDEGILACIDAATGELRWKDGRYGHGQLLLVQGALLVLSDRGELVLVAAQPDAFLERARFAAIEGRTWNNPAIASGVLLVRNGREMAAYRIGAGGEA